VIDWRIILSLNIAESLHYLRKRWIECFRDWLLEFIVLLFQRIIFILESLHGLLSLFSLVIFLLKLSLTLIDLLIVYYQIIFSFIVVILYDLIDFFVFLKIVSCQLKIVFYSVHLLLGFA